jgi:hypothetical protein
MEMTFNLSADDFYEAFTADQDRSDPFSSWLMRTALALLVLGVAILAVVAVISGDSRLVLQTPVMVVVGLLVPRLSAASSSGVVPHQAVVGKWRGHDPR